MTRSRGRFRSGARCNAPAEAECPTASKDALLGKSASENVSSTCDHCMPTMCAQSTTISNDVLRRITIATGGRDEGGADTLSASSVSLLRQVASHIPFFLPNLQLLVHQILLESWSFTYRLVPHVVVSQLALTCILCTMAATPSHPSTRRGQRPLGADASHALGPDTGRRRVNFVDQHYEPWPSDSSRPTGSAPLDVEHSVRPSWRTRNAETRNNALAPEGPSPPSMYTMDSQAGSDFSIQDYFPTPEAARPSVPERRPSGLMIADEEATSPLSFGEDEPTDDPFRATVETEASAPMSGPPRSPGTGIHLAESPTSNGDRMGRGRRYDEAPTPGIFGLRRRASSLDSQTSAVADGRRRNMRRAGTPRFDSYSGVAGDLLGNCQIESPIEESDYFSFKEAANPGGRTDPHIYEEVSPKSMPVAIPEAAHTREAAQSWNNGHVEPKGKTDNNPASTNRDSLNASTITLVTPVDESKLDATPKKSFGSLSLFRRKGKDSVDDSPPGHSRQAYREKVKSMRNGEKLRPSYKRLTTGRPTPLRTPRI